MSETNYLAGWDSVPVPAWDGLLDRIRAVGRDARQFVGVRRSGAVRRRGNVLRCQSGRRRPRPPGPWMAAPGRPVRFVGSIDAVPTGTPAPHPADGHLAAVRM
jgi:hypothetical protein